MDSNWENQLLCSSELIFAYLSKLVNMNVLHRCDAILEELLFCLWLEFVCTFKHNHKPTQFAMQNMFWQIVFHDLMIYENKLISPKNEDKN